MTSLKTIAIIYVALIIAISSAKKQQDPIENKREENYGQTYYGKSYGNPKHHTLPTLPTLPTTEPTPECVPDFDKEHGYRVCIGTVRNMTIDVGCGKKVVCLVPSTEELLDRLNQMGGYNRHYVALTEEEASSNFDNLLPEVIPSTGSKAHPGKKIGHHRIGHPHFKPHKRATEFIHCLKAGDSIKRNQQLKRLMCPICQRTTKLAKDVFPRYINEITCDSSPLGYSVLSAEKCRYSDDIKFGGCYQKSMLIDLLTKKDEDYELVNSDGTTTIYKQVWSQKTQEIRTCCECLL